MSTSHRSQSWRIPVVLAVAMLSATPAAAQNFFESLFGGFRHRSDAAYSQPRPQALPYADPAAPLTPSTPGVSIAVPPASGGPAAHFCVRLCDGRYFPVQRHAKMTPIQACSAMCPAAKTKIFHGSEIAHARAGDGTRYDSLDKAYVYRKQVVADCTCNGKTPFGLAPIDVVSDPTLRAGDMVATETGMVKFTGSPMELRKSIGVAAAEPTEPTPPQPRRRKLAADIRASVN